jgi:hypothetical protein
LPARLSTAASADAWAIWPAAGVCPAASAVTRRRRW